MGDYDYRARLPAAIGEEARWFEYCRRKQLMIQRCAACDVYLFPPRSVCPECLAADPVWVEAAGTGTVYTFTVQHRDAAGFEGQAPYTIAMIDLDEGVRMMSRIAGSPEDVRIGMAVEVRWAEITDDGSVPVFVPATESASRGG